MKIRNIYANAFGILKNKEINLDDKNIKIIFGRNEAGKSTLFNLISCILYGFRPSSRENNPYVPWEESMVLCEADIVKDTGDTVRVIRSLGSRPTGKMLWKDERLELRNNPLPWLEGLPVEVFSEVFALDIDDMRFPRSQAWQSVQDRLLGGQYANFLNPVSGLIENLEQRANQLWRIDRRGKPKSREIEQRLRELTGQLKKARENDQILRNSKIKHAQMERELNELREKKINIISKIETYEKIFPIIRKLDRGKHFKEMGKGVEQLDKLPENPLNRLHEIDEKIDGLKRNKATLLNTKEEFNKKIAKLTAKEELIINNADRIRVLVRAYDRIKADMEELYKLRQELITAEQSLHSLWEEVMLDRWDPGLIGVLESFDFSLLRSALGRFKKVEEQYIKESLHLENLQRRANRTILPPYTPIISVVVFMLGTISVFKGNSVYPGLFAGIFAASLFLAWWYLNKRDLNNLSYYESKFNETEKSRNKIIEEIKSKIDLLSFPENRSNPPDESLLSDVSRLRERALHIKSIERRIDDLAQRLSKDKLFIETTLKLTDEFSTGDNMLNDITYLEIRLNECEKLLREKEEAVSELKYIKAEISKIDYEYELLTKEMVSIKEALELMDGDTLEKKSEEFIKRRDYIRNAQNIMESLYRDYSDIEKILSDIEKIRNSDIEITDEEIIRLKEERNMLEYRINNLMEGIGTLKKDIEFRITISSPADIQGEIECLKDEKNKVMRERDRLMFLKNILYEADRIFREEHQPDVLKKAGLYLKIITSDCYDRLIMNQERDQVLEIRETSTGRTRDVCCLSRGTQEQIYLALRFALIEHLNPANECMPVFIDEVFVNWDKMRLDNGLKILMSLGEKRQVFLFTCHDWLVEKFNTVLDAQVITL